MPTPVADPHYPVPGAETRSGASTGFGRGTGAEHNPCRPHYIANPAAANPAQRHADCEPAHAQNSLARLRTRATRCRPHKIVADGLAALAAGFLDGIHHLAHHRAHLAGHAGLLGHLARYGCSLVLAQFNPAFWQRPEAILLLDQQYFKLAGRRPAIYDTTGSCDRRFLLNRILH